MRKPAQAAWHLNRLAREDPETFRRALDARVQLQDVQQSLLGGDKTAAELRAGIAAERNAFDAVLAAIRRLDGEIGDTVSRRIRETLRAAGDDTALHDDALAGRLVSEARPEPVWPPSAGAPAQQDAPPQPGEEPGPDPAEDAKTEAHVRRDAERARKEHEQRLERAREEHEQQLERARKRVRGAESDAERAAARSARAGETRRRAEARLADAVTAERDALAAEREAAQALEALRSELGESAG